MKNLSLVKSLNKFTDKDEITDRFSVFNRYREQKFDYKGILASSDVYGIHPYPAMFHYLLVRHFIINFSRKDSIILDPFVGSGVSAVESLINKRKFIGLDINPLAILIAKARTTPLTSSDILDSLEKIISKYLSLKPTIFEFENIHYWFDEDTIGNLTKLKNAIYSLKSEKILNFFIVVFSEVVRKVSRTRFNEFKLFRKKDFSNSLDVLKVFKDVALKNSGLLINFYKKFSINEQDIILKEDNILSTNIVEDDSINLIITSPPYGDSRTTVAYGQFSRLSLKWLSKDEKVDKTSLGPKGINIEYNLPSEILYKMLNIIADIDQKRANEVFSFYFDLKNSIDIICGKLEKKGFICFVVGNRKVKGFELPTDKICVDFFINKGLKHIKTFVREISNKRMPLENSPTNVQGSTDSTMRYEYIVLFQK